MSGIGIASRKGLAPKEESRIRMRRKGGFLGVAEDPWAGRINTKS